jgi:hypothetical protein
LKFWEFSLKISFCVRLLLARGGLFTYVISVS